MKNFKLLAFATILIIAVILIKPRWNFNEISDFFHKKKLGIGAMTNFGSEKSIALPENASK